MDLTRPPQWSQWMNDLLPEGARDFLNVGGWYGVLGVAGLLLLLLLWAVLGGLVRGLFRRPPAAPPKDELGEDLSAIPPAPPHSGDVRLTVEGTPVRLRLVVVAPAGTGYTIPADAVHELLDRALPGLGEIAARDQPRTRVWPKQLSYEGFANTFHRNTPVPEGEKKPSCWVLVAGRADLGARPVLIGLGLQTVRPSTLGRMTLEPHQWGTVLRVRVKES
jgi:hypothetical protein